MGPRLPASAKLSIIGIVENAELSKTAALKLIGIPRSAYYRWLKRLHETGEVENGHGRLNHTKLNGTLTFVDAENPGKGSRSRRVRRTDHGSGHGYGPQPFKVIQENRQDFVLLRGYATSMAVGEMEIYSVAPRISALTLLVATLLLVGMPRPTMAAGQKDVAVTRHCALTINGRPLSEFVALPAPPPVPPPHRRRVSADRLLGGEPVTDSLDALTLILDPGYEVVVRDEAGRKTRGRVSFISGEEVVVINRPRLFRYLRSPQEHAFRA